MLNVPGTCGEPAGLYIDQKIDFSYPIPFRDFKKGFPLWAALAFAKFHYPKVMWSQLRNSDTKKYTINKILKGL